MLPGNGPESSPEMSSKALQTIAFFLILALTLSVGLTGGV